jgi:hypothetical protein
MNLPLTAILLSLTCAPALAQVPSGRDRLGIPPTPATRTTATRPAAGTATKPAAATITFLTYNAKSEGLTPAQMKQLTDFRLRNDTDMQRIRFYGYLANETLETLAAAGLGNTKTADQKPDDLLPKPLVTSFTVEFKYLDPFTMWFKVDIQKLAPIHRSFYTLYGGEEKIPYVRLQAPNLEGTLWVNHVSDLLCSPYGSTQFTMNTGQQRGKGQVEYDTRVARSIGEGLADPKPFKPATAYYSPLNLTVKLIPTPEDTLLPPLPDDLTVDETYTNPAPGNKPGVRTVEYSPSQGGRPRKIINYVDPAKTTIRSIARVDWMNVGTTDDPDWFPKTLILDKYLNRRPFDKEDVRNIPYERHTWNFQQNKITRTGVLFYFPPAFPAGSRTVAVPPRTPGHG